MSDAMRGFGKTAYEAYGAAVDWTAYNGSPIKPWDEADPIRQHAWNKAAETVAESVSATAAAAFLEMIPAQRRGAAVTEVAHAIGVDLAAISPAVAVGGTATPASQTTATAHCENCKGCCT